MDGPAICEFFVTTDQNFEPKSAAKRLPDGTMVRRRLRICRRSFRKKRWMPIFLSNYRWEDGVGPKELRPRTTDAAWQTVEPNEVGTDEFHRFAGLVGAEVMMAVNLGTRGPEDAKNLYEYCNFEAGSKYADMRVKDGRSAPYGDRVWCLGNEMDGPWQVGNRSPKDYAETARKTAQLLKRMDPGCELVACGSSNYDMPTFGEWGATVLEEAYDYVEYLSLHQYYKNRGNTPEYLAMSEQMNRFIRTVTSVCDYVKGKNIRRKPFTCRSTSTMSGASSSAAIRKECGRSLRGGKNMSIRWRTRCSSAVC